MGLCPSNHPYSVAQLKLKTVESFFLCYLISQPKLIFMLGNLLRSFWYIIHEVANPQHAFKVTHRKCKDYAGCWYMPTGPSLGI